MRNLVLVLVLMLAAGVPAFAIRRVTAVELEKLLSATHERNDAKVASQISGLELTERLSAARMGRIRATLPGAKATQALVTLADVAEFLDLPASECPALAPPGSATQDSLVALVANWVRHSIPKLPDFLATRMTARFEDTPAEPATLDAPTIFYDPLHLVGVSSANVVNREGQEQVDIDDAKGRKPGSPLSGLETSGEFGTVLITLMTDVLRGEIDWKGWESGQDGRLAVFRYSVPQQMSHYTVKIPGGWRNLQTQSAYHGEIAFDPAGGSVRRVTLEAELRPDDLISKANLFVEYGPVEIGGKRYILPTRSVALAEVRAMHPVLNSQGGAYSYLGPPQTQLNDVQFENYHLFRGELRVVTEVDRQPVGNLPGAIPGGAQASEPASAPAH
jgi:hypothetical protein